MANILIVEDNELNFELASELLECSGHKIIWAKDGEQCFDAVNKEKFDLILMDIGLPFEDGLSLTKRLKLDISYRNIPIIAFTAMVMAEDREQAKLAGCDGFIPKPIEISTFASTVESFILKKHRPHNILVIDDNVMNAEMIKDTMESLNQHVKMVHNGTQALEIIEKEKFDLILLDIMMPGMNGFDVIKELKANPKTANLPVIFISALDSTDNIVKGFSLGSYEYIVKPFKIAELKARILNILKIKDLQDELAAEKKILDIVFDFSADGIVLLNTKFELISCNEIFLKWVEKEKWQVISKKFCELINCNLTDCYLNANNSNSIHFYYELLIGDKKRYLGINLTKVLSNINEIEGYVLILRDITSQKEVEAQKETFVATLTHDLKTPVRAQTQALQMLLDGKFGKINDAQAEIITETLKSNKFMASMLNNLLSTYKYENGNIVLNKTETDINSLIKSCHNELKYIAEDKQQNIIFDFAETDLKIIIDPVEVKRIVQNLLFNAISYTQEGGKIIISTKNNGSNAIISFNDNGKGLSEEEKASLFNKFTSHAKKFRQVGTGLGLYLSKHIAEMHGGSISVESEEGKGSCFTVTIPF